MTIPVTPDIHNAQPCATDINRIQIEGDERSFQVFASLKSLTSTLQFHLSFGCSNHLSFAHTFVSPNDNSCKSL